MKVHRVKTIFRGALLPLGLLLSTAATAQTVPSAGSLNQQIERERPQLPPKPAPEIRVEQPGAPLSPAVAGQKITVRQLRISGAQLYPEASLLALTGFRGEAALSLAELRAMAKRISSYYREQGYFLAQAYLPAQDIRDGVVTIAVLEGRYGQLSVRNQAAVPQRVLDAVLDGMGSGDAVAIAPLESRLLQLSDLPGVGVQSTLVPGASVGASDLIIDLTPGARVSGYIDADNQGNRYTGSDRLGTTFQINNLSGAADLLSVQALTSTGGMRYGRLAYQAPLGRATAGLAYSRMHYRLGEEFASLRASGEASIASLYGSYPLLRSRGQNLSAQLHFDDKSFQDRADATTSSTDKRARVAILSLLGDVVDPFAGANTYALSWSRGEIDIAGAAALAADAASVRSNGRYDKLAFNASHLQALNDSVSLSAALSGQLASKNLDVSEKLGLGGNGGVRAYPSGEAYGDLGYVINLEARALLPGWSASLPGRLSMLGFVDHGSVRLNKNSWSTGANRRTLSGAGVGLSWAAPRSFAVNASVASKLGNGTASSAPDRKLRFWLQGISYF